MKYDGSGDTNCKNYPGQKVAEMIFGTTVTRGAIKTANDAKKNIKKNLSDLTSGNPKKMAKAAVKMVVDPFGINKKIAKGAVKAGKSYVKNTLKSTKQNLKDLTSGNPKKMAKAVFRQVTDPGGVRSFVTKKVVPKAVRKGVSKAVKSVGKFFCFSPNTRVRLKSGELVYMKDLKLGDILVGDIIVDATMQIRNESDPYYKIYSKELNEYIYVTGRHYIKHDEKYIQVKDFPGAEPTNEIGGVLSCLVTSDHTIPIGEYTFWDWEDNLVPSTP